MSRLITSKQACVVLGIANATLGQRRTNGHPPTAFYSGGKYYYELDECLELAALIDSPEVCRRLGFTRQSLFGARNRGTLKPRVRVGQYFYYHPDDVERYRQSVRSPCIHRKKTP